MPRFAISLKLDADYPQQIKRLRVDLGLTQEALAEKLGVSFATVNRWENGQTKPSKLSWTQLRQLESTNADEASPESKSKKEAPPVILDFTASADIVVHTSIHEQKKGGKLGDTFLGYAR